MKILISIYNRFLHMNVSGPDDPSASVFIVDFTNHNPEFTRVRIDGLIPYARFITDLEGVNIRTVGLFEKDTPINPKMWAKVQDAAQPITFGQLILKLLQETR